jgi:hypothetical protein
MGDSETENCRKIIECRNYSTLMIAKGINRLAIQFKGATDSIFYQITWQLPANLNNGKS